MFHDNHLMVVLFGPITAHDTTSTNGGVFFFLSPCGRGFECAACRSAATLCVRRTWCTRHQTLSQRTRIAQPVERRTYRCTSHRGEHYQQESSHTRHGLNMDHASCIMYHASCIMYHASCIMDHGRRGQAQPLSLFHQSTVRLYIL